MYCRRTTGDQGALKWRDIVPADMMSIVGSWTIDESCHDMLLLSDGRMVKKPSLFTQWVWKEEGAPGWCAS